MLGTLPASVFHPEASLLQYYLEKGIPVSTGPPWSREVLKVLLKTVPMHNYEPQGWQGSSGGRCSGGYRMALAYSSLQRTRCRYLERGSSYPKSQRYPRHSADRVSPSIYRQNLIKVRRVLTAPQIEKSPLSRCSLGKSFC